MLYATIDYSNKKQIINRCRAEEVLGEVKICVPKTTSNTISKTILRKVKRYNVQNIVLSKEVGNNNEIKMQLLNSKKYIINGSRMGKALLPRIVLEISKYAKFPREKLKVLLLMDEYSIENIDLIECISKDVKQLTVISKNYKKYERCANKLYEQYGYMVKLYPKEVLEAKKDCIVINLDFSKEEIKKMSLNRHAIIISLNEKLGKLKRSFDGIVINDLDIMGEGLENKNFRKLSICEAKLYRPLRKVRDNEMFFFTQKYIINGYIGNNGKITGEEFEEIGKNFA